MAVFQSQKGRDAIACFKSKNYYACISVLFEISYQIITCKNIKIPRTESKCLSIDESPKKLIDKEICVKFLVTLSLMLFLF